MTAAETFTRYPDLPGFAKENRELVYAMVEAGWTGRITSKGHWLGKAPDGKATITVPAKNGNNRGLKNAHATFMRWLREHVPAEERRIWDAAKESGNPLVQDVIADGLVRKQTQRMVAENMERTHREFIEMVKSDPRVIIEPLVRPWMAKKQPGKQGGVLYESEAVLERVWPTGETDYACAFPGCEYHSENPRGVAAHYGKAHTLKGQVEPASQDGPHVIDPAYTEPTTTRDYRPTQRLVDALADWIDTTDLSASTPQELAVLFLTWAHYRDDLDHEPRPLVPLTEKDILNKIRLLVGQPDLSVELEEARRQRDEANAHLVRVQRDLDALSDMVKGIGR
jgi:hypothetical protein